jgi:hypothetical protein
MDTLFFIGTELLREFWFGFLLGIALLVVGPVLTMISHVKEDHQNLPLFWTLIWSSIGLWFVGGGIRFFYAFNGWEAIGGYLLYFIIGMACSKYYWNNLIIDFRNKFLMVQNNYLLEKQFDLDYFKTGSNAEYHYHLRQLHDSLVKEFKVSYQGRPNDWKHLVEMLVPSIKDHKILLAFVVVWWPVALLIYLVTDLLIAGFHATMNLFGNFYSSTVRKHFGDNF